MDYKKKYLKYKLKYLNIIKGGTTECGSEKMNKYCNSIGRENISYGCWWGTGTCDKEDRWATENINRKLEIHYKLIDKTLDTETKDMYSCALLAWYMKQRSLLEHTEEEVMLESDTTHTKIYKNLENYLEKFDDDFKWMALADSILNKNINKKLPGAEGARGNWPKRYIQYLNHDCSDGDSPTEFNFKIGFPGIEIIEEKGKEDKFKVHIKIDKIKKEKTEVVYGPKIIEAANAYNQLQMEYDKNSKLGVDLPQGWKTIT